MNKHFARETIDFFMMPVTLVGYIMAWVKGFYTKGGATAIQHAIWLYSTEDAVKAAAKQNADLIAKLREIYPDAEITQIGDTVKVNDNVAKTEADKSKLH